MNALIQVIAAIGLMSESGLRYSPVLDEEALERKARAYLLVLEVRGIDAEWIMPGARLAMSELDEFPSAKTFADLCERARIAVKAKSYSPPALPVDTGPPATPEEIEEILSGMTEGAKAMLAVATRLPDGPAYQMRTRGKA